MIKVCLFYETVRSPHPLCCLYLVYVCILYVITLLLYTNTLFLFFCPLLPQTPPLTFNVKLILSGVTFTRKLIRGTISYS